MKKRIVPIAGVASSGAGRIYIIFTNNNKIELLLAKYKHKYAGRHTPISNIYLDWTKYFCKNILSSQKQIFICNCLDN